MVQIINMPKSPSWGETIGDAINEGISSGMNQYLSRKNRQDELAEQYKYASLRDKDIERREIAKEQRGKEEIFQAAHANAIRLGYKPGTPEYESNVILTYNQLKFNPKSAEHIFSMTQRQANAQNRDFQDYSKKQSGYEGPAAKEQVEQQEQISLEHTNEYSQFNQNSHNQAPTAQGPQIVFDDRVAKQTQPMANEEASSGIPNNMNNADSEYVGKDGLRHRNGMVYDVLDNKMQWIYDKPEDAPTSQEAYKSVRYNTPRDEWDKNMQYWNSERAHGDVVNKTGVEKIKFDWQKKKDIGDTFTKQIESIQKNAKEKKELLPSYEIAIAKNEQMDTKPTSLDAMIEASGSKFLNMFKSKNAQEFEAQIPSFLGSLKSKMGGTITNAKLDLIARKLPGVGKYKDANRLLLYTGFYDAKLANIEEEMATKIRGENEGFAPVDFDTKLKKAMRPYQQQVSDDLNLLIEDKAPIIGINLGISFTNLPPPGQEFIGETVRDTKTGKRYQTNDGTKWTEVK